MAEPILDNDAIRQSMFNTLRDMANINLSSVYGDDVGYLQYPWELIDRIQVDYRNAVSDGDLKRARKIEMAIDTLRIWRNSLVELNNTRVPNEDKNEWFV